MWIKFTYLLRAFESTGYLIRMIIEVIKDMLPFLIVLVFACIAFADATFSVSNGQVFENEGWTTEEERWDDRRFLDDFETSFKFVYLLTLGEFQYNDIDSA